MAKNSNWLMCNNILDISKIRTGVPGFDDLFYGGLRLPGWKETNGRDGICIVIYGDRGISKSDLAMQIMRGVNDYLKKIYGAENKLTPKYQTLNHRESELRKKYVGLEVGGMIDDIKLPDVRPEAVHTCRLCLYFPNIRERLNGMVSTCPPSLHPCDADEIKDCLICKLLRHEIINYSDRSQSMHWTYGDVSDTSNLLDNLKEDAIDAGRIFEKGKDEDAPSSNYQSIAYRRFKEFQKEISDAANELDKEKAQVDIESVGFKWSSYVIEGFTAFRDDELLRLPFTDLILKLRKTAAVSILVLDERGDRPHLNADIIVHMRYNTDIAAQYTYYELQIVKSDLQQHVHGWHKYRKLRDLSVKIYPSMHSLLTRRFSSDNAVLRLEQDNMRYPQSLLHRFQSSCARWNDVSSIGFANIISNALSDKSDKANPYSPDNTACTIELVDAQSYPALYDFVLRKTANDDTTVAVFLLGKTEQHFRQLIQSRDFPESSLKNLHYWETSLGCIWAEEYTSIIKEYIYRWKKLSKQKNLHIVIDDIANINLYPLMNREQLFIPVVANVCKNAAMLQGFDENDRGINILLSLVCTCNEISQYKQISQIINNQ